MSGHTILVTDPYPARDDEDGAVGARALALVIRLHREGTLSEGQCIAALQLDRYAFRELVDLVGERVQAVFYDRPNCRGTLR